MLSHLLQHYVLSITKRLVKRVILLLLFSCAGNIVFSQNLKGIWAGKLTSDTSGVPVLNTEYVLNVKEQNNKTISGRAYVMQKRFAFEGVLDFIGNIDNNKLKISELRIVSSKVPINTKLLCIKILDLTLTLTDSTDYLQGHWTGVQEDRTPCIPGTAYLIRNKPGYRSVVPPELLSKIAADNAPATFLNTRLGQAAIIDVRNNVLVVEINDYLKEDMDTVSVYVNRRTFIRKLMIQKKPERRTLRIDPNAGLSEIIMYAENLGMVPPNTSTLIIDDGYTKQRVLIESTKEISAVIYLRYLPPK